ncbi:cobyric acid synthase [Tumebacillus permanentifrigoris]|uniref:Cobyric acid synthase n=1 Tax=Tumebacillus permanentifrigoris TaxID=378543 RepID=A0A316DDF2_9BACL|nr:cobyric acid synthase [Tumebacillus permanentifrigoris]PWK14820.1 adenosylcobyric acid synthase (glutamine-hydrolysing) [Tumebacillus permanentifrigoris]
MTLIHALMIQGTSSDAGKSLLCTGLCRIFKEDGVHVAPFKSQNMALNSYITSDGGEIGRAQGVQAEACGLEATVDMNPILLKPKAEMISEVIVHGKHFADLEAFSYREEYVPKVLPKVAESIERLATQFDLLVVEGAGSPAEINLKDRDIANMRIADMLDCPVLLVADIERGGVFASLVGTLELLEPHERARVKGFLINKFRGRKELLDSGLVWLEERTGIPVLGVIPHFDHGIDPEDSLALDSLRLKARDRADADLDIAVIKFPRISNFTDVVPLQEESGVNVRFVSSARALGKPDLILLPGSKNTVEDLLWLRHTGLADAILALDGKHTIVGLCGGFQMLGETLYDPDRVESVHEHVSGLGLLTLETTFLAEKKTIRNRGRLLPQAFSAHEVEGYEIHLGRTDRKSDAPFLQFDSGEFDGAISKDGRVIGTYLHGLFQNRAFTRDFLNHLRVQKGIAPLLGDVETEAERREKSYARLAAHLRQHVDLERVYEIIGGRHVYVD